MRAFATCLALSALLLAGCAVGPRPGNWEAFGELPALTMVDHLLALHGGTVVAIGEMPDRRVAAAVYDVAHSAWLPAVESPLATENPDASPLANGEVLITSLQASWRFRPADASWQPAALMNHRRYAYATASLADGRLFACGGSDETGLSLASCEIYDPAADRWLTSASMSIGRFGPLETTLSDGRVFVTGGAFNPSTAQDGSFQLNLDPLDTSETFNPTTGAFSPGPAYLDPVTDPTLVGIPDGSLLAIGGRQGQFTRTSTTQELDPRTGRWSLRAAPAAQGAGVLLADGRILVIGRGPGQGFFGPGGGAIYDPAIDLWTPITPPPSEHSPGLAAPLSDGRVLTVGIGSPPASAVFNPQGLPPLPGRDLPLASRQAVLGLAALAGALLLLVMARAGRRTR